MKPLDNYASSADKITLFRSLFRGREDVYPRRFENRRTGQAGYAPACGNEWIQGVCDKPRIKCSACSHQRFLAVTDEVIGRHLSGRDEKGREFVVGVYPMLRDETCFFLAIDLDKADWQADARALLETCRSMRLAAALERSRSGNGAHIWLFFADSVPASVARKLGAHLITETMERRPEIGLSSYDRFFPNQDTLPQGGFGNLIALPLQKRPRESGNSVFVDEHLCPYKDQWEFLSDIPKIERSRLEKLVEKAEERGSVVGVCVTGSDDATDPWRRCHTAFRHESPCLGQLPSNIQAVLSNQLYFSKADLTPSLKNRILRLAAFQNPEFYRAQAMRLPTYDKPRIISCAEDHSAYIAIPRGCLEDSQRLLSGLGINFIIDDVRFLGRSLSVEFQGQLYPEQEAAATDLLAHDMGVLAATTAFGKTVVAAWLIARRGVNTLVVVNRRQLLEQWVERLASFLNLSPNAIGRIGGGRKTPTGSLDVALVQSLVRKGVVDDLVAGYGQLVVDECHHVAARSFEEVLRQAKAKFVVGLSATLARKDGHHPIISMQCGPVRHRVDARSQALIRPFKHLVMVRPTGFRFTSVLPEDRRLQFSELQSLLTVNEARNRLICEDVLQSVREGRSPLVLTERKAHLDLLEASLSPQIKNLIVLRGGMSRGQIRLIADRLAEVPESEDRVLLATGRYLGEGFDDARLDTLFLTLPVSWHGTIAQYAGRLHRLHYRKREVRIYDYADLDIPMLARMFDRRGLGYEAVGYRIQLPASAVPGWPIEVVLPVDPPWKNDYAATVQRLIRDGVDSPLANLFAHVACDAQLGSEGNGRARSATEAFLYCRLESLPDIRGRFRLNAVVPIPFDGEGQMEIDLLCSDARIAIEIDGPQHLQSLDAYRRDRRKDTLLQEHGFFVLRFLAEDVGKQLDKVLDAIHRAFAHRRAASKDQGT